MASSPHALAVEATSRPRKCGHETPQLWLERRLHDGSPCRSSDLVSAGPEEVREVIGENYPGVLVTDRGKSYDAKELEEVKQQKCIPHALRSINQVSETKQG